MKESEELGSRLHHRDVVGVALRRLERDLVDRPDEVLEEIKRAMPKN